MSSAFTSHEHRVIYRVKDDTLLHMAVVYIVDGIRSCGDVAAVVSAGNGLASSEVTVVANRCERGT